MMFRPSQLTLRSLAYYWRTNLAVMLGVATAVAVLAGALLVGDSVRGSLRDLVVQRLGRVDHVVASAGFFREQLAKDIESQPEFSSAFSGLSPIVIVQGVVTAQESRRRAGHVLVYGIDDRFWRFHGLEGISGPQERETFFSPALAKQLDVREGDAVLVRVQRPTDVPLESLHGRKDDLGRTLRLTIRSVLPSSALGEFSLAPQQADVRAAFVPLSRLQQEIEIDGRVNTLLASTREGDDAAASRLLEQLVRRQATLDDLGLTVRALETRGVFVVGSKAGLLDDRQATTAEKVIASSGMHGQAMFTYLANSLRVGDREIPYSLVTALDLRTILRKSNPNDPNVPNGSNVPNDSNAPNDPIVLNEWAASDLGARTGDAIAMEYYAWEEPGQLVTRNAEFYLAGVVPIEVADREFTPTLAGITESASLDNWDPPFPIDLRRVRKMDEDYWERYRTTPKAFVPLEVGQRLWRSRYGAMTSIRVTPGATQSLDIASDNYAGRLRAAIDPIAAGLSVRSVRSEGLSASRGATDFGAYFTYFSFFIVVSALLLAALFFKLGVEQRLREVGLLRAVGFGPRAVRSLFLREGLLLAVIGSAVGVLGAVGYAGLMMLALRTWWVDAVGTTALTLHLSLPSLLGGALGGIAAAVVCIWWTLRALNRISERSLLAAELSADESLTPTTQRAPVQLPRRRRLLVATSGLVVIGAGLLLLAAAGRASPAGAFFGAGSSFLGAALCLCLFILRRQPSRAIDGRAWQPVLRLGLRSATYRPGRSVLAMSVIASATFILISVDAFRREGRLMDPGRRSGVGGYSLVVDTLLPVVQDPNTRDGRNAMNLSSLDASVTIEPFRLRPGDDASCLNLYEPTNPRILAPRDAFLEEARFVFSDSLASTDMERANPWLLLRRQESDGAIPVVADANSMTYVLHRQLGDDIVIPHAGGKLRLRLVAALRDSILQGELLMSEANFLRLFPEQEGYRFLLVETPSGRSDEVASAIENALVDFGADATGTTERLAQFHQVENTYLSTFQTLGGLGLLLGTVGLAAVLLRNVLERRRELALLGAVGYRRSHFTWMVVSENMLLVGCGLVAGAMCALLAITPAAAERGSRIPLTSGALLLLFGVLATGLIASLVATRAAVRAPLLESLRSE